MNTQTKKTVLKRSLIIATLAVMALMVFSAIATTMIFAHNTMPANTGPNRVATGFSGITQLENESLNHDLATRFLAYDKELAQLSGPRRLIVELTADSLIEHFNACANIQYTYETPANYFRTRQAGEIIDNLYADQNAFLRALRRERIDFELNYNFTTIFNGVSITTSPSYTTRLLAMDEVRSVKVTSPFEAPQLDQVAVINRVNAMATGIYDTRGLEYQGEGIVVAVLDTGIDYGHPAFSVQPNNPSMSRADVLDALSGDVVDPTNLYQHNHNLMYARRIMAGMSPEALVDQVHVSDKIPFMFNYADRRPSAFPRDGSSHGIHVAGIIAGYDPRPIAQQQAEAPRDFPNVFDENHFRGVAPQAQLVIMNVFSAYRTGADFDDILAAVADSVILGVDVINMSLGRTSGFSREYGDSHLASFTRRVYDSVNAAGINLVVAAGNAATSGLGSPFGTNLTSNPDSGTVGSPASYAGALAVANISGQFTPYVTVNDGVSVSYINEFVNAAGQSFNFIDELLRPERARVQVGANSRFPLDPNSVSHPDITSRRLNFVVIGGYGEGHDFTPAVRAMMQAEPTVAVIMRGGGLAFYQKARNAYYFGAYAVIIYNNVPGMLRPTLGIDRVLPTSLINLEDGLAMAALGHGTIYLCRSQYAGPFMIDSSSWGPTPDLRLKPEITAHGGDIIAPVIGGYGAFSGTSMAAPNIAGAMAILRQHIRAAYAYENAGATIDNLELMHRANGLLMSTATIARDRRNIPYSPRRQGAGIGDIHNAIDTEAYLFVQGQDMPKLELFDDPNRTGEYELVFNLRNRSLEAQTFRIQTTTMTETVAPGGRAIAEKGYLLNPAVAISYDGLATLTGTNITVPAGETVELTIILTLNAGDMQYMDDNFKNGIFVDGFVEFINANLDGVDISIPFLAFYGDWAAAPMFDYNIFDVSADEHNFAVQPEDRRVALTRPSVPLGRAERDNGEDLLRFLGQFAYVQPANALRDPLVTRDRIAIGNSNFGVYAIHGLFAGMLRGARAVDIEVYNVQTGEPLLETREYNIIKGRAGGGSIIPVHIDAAQKGLPNNTHLRVNMKGELDWPGGDWPGGEGVRPPNHFETFDVFVDYQVPEVVNARVRTTYSGINQDIRSTMLDLSVFDNNFVQAVQLFKFLPDSSIYTITDYPIPVSAAERGSVSSLSVDITAAYYGLLNQPSNIPSGMMADGTPVYRDHRATIGVWVVDHAFNSALWILPLNPAYDYASDLNITSSRLTDGVMVLTAGEVAQFDLSLEQGNINDVRIGVENLTGNANDPVVRVQDGRVHALREGSARVTIAMPNGDATVQFVVNVATSSTVQQHNLTSARFTAMLNHRLTFDNTPLRQSVDVRRDTTLVDNGADFSLELTFNPFFATFDLVNEPYNAATGVRGWVMPSGRVMRLSDADEYGRVIYWTSTNTDVLTVDDTGRVTTMSPGNAAVMARVLNGHGPLPWADAIISFRVGNEFYNRFGYLYSYHGPGFTHRAQNNLCPILNVPMLIIPSNLGLRSIAHFNQGRTGPFYGNHDIRSVVVPFGVVSIGDRAFANSSVEVVFLPPTIENISSRAFQNSPVRYIYWLTDDAFFNELTHQYDRFEHGLDFVACSTTANVLAINIGGLAFAPASALPQGETRSEDFVYWPRNLVQFDTSRVIAVGAQDFFNQPNFVGAPVGQNGQNIVDLQRLRFSGFAAFANTNVQTVVLGEFTSLSSNMFNNANLSQVDFFGSSIPTSAFANNSNLTRFTFHNDVATIGSSAFAGTSSLTSITLPNGNLTIGNNAFAGSGIVTVYIDQDTEFNNISDLAFGRANSLREFRLVGGTNANFTIASLTLGSDTFTILANSNQTEIVLVPTALSNRSDFTLDMVLNALDPLANLTHIGDSAFNDARLTGELVIPDGVISIGDFAFSGNLITSLSLPSTLRYVGRYAFSHNLNLTTVTFRGTSQLAEISEGMFYSSMRLVSITLPNSITSIGANAFRQPATGMLFSFTSITIPSGVTEIGASAFQNSRLTTVQLAAGTSLETIGANAFRNSNLSLFGIAGFGGTPANTINLPIGLTTIGHSAFRNAFGGTGMHVMIPGTVSSMGDFAFAYNNTNTTRVTVANGVTYISNFAFAPAQTAQPGFISITQIIEVNLPISLTTIGVSAFEAAINLQTIDLGAVEYIHESAFADNRNLHTVSFSANLRYIGDEAFLQARFDASLNPVVNLGGVLSVGDRAFLSAGVRQVVANELTHIGEQAFAINPNLTSFIAPSLEYIGWLAFRGGTIAGGTVVPTALTTLNAPNLVSLDQNALAGASLTTFHIGEHVRHIEDGAFAGATLSWVGGGRSSFMANFTSMTYNPNNPYFFVYGNVLYRRLLPLSLGRYEAIAFTAPANSLITSVTIREGTVRIAGSAFWTASHLVTVYLPSTLVTIGDAAFWRQDLVDLIDTPNREYYSTTTIHFTSLHAPALEIPVRGFVAGGGSIRYLNHRNFGGWAGDIANNFVVPSNGIGYTSFLFGMFAAYAYEHELDLMLNHALGIAQRGHARIRSMFGPEVITPATQAVFERIETLRGVTINPAYAEEIIALSRILAEIREGGQFVFITNYSVFTAAYTAVMQIINNLVQPIITDIDLLPSVITDANTTAIRALRFRIDNLPNATVRSFVTNYSYFVAAEIALTVTSYVERIASLPTPITLANEAEIISLRTAIDLLTVTQRNAITNLNVFVAAEQFLAVLRVQTRINALPSTILIANQAEINAINALITPLTVAQRNQLGESYATFRAAQQAVTALLAGVQQAIDDINLLYGMEIAAHHYDLFISIRELVLSLTPEQLNLVTNLDLFLNADVALVVALIDALPSRINAAAGDRIRQIRAILDGFNAEQIAAVTNLAAFESAEASYLRGGCGGCGGSVNTLSGSIIIFIIAALGLLAILLLKAKKLKQ